MQPNTVEDLQAIVQSHERLVVQGGSSKRALSVTDPAVNIIDMRGLSGILEYEPGEYTFTARAGTSLRAVEAALAAHHQFLPFDPPLIDEGATLGGTVAAGLSGAGRYRYGGVRDFLIGVRFVDGQGRLVRGGGKVVKNAAGFDLPKLMVGSLGQFGIMTELSFKVFPQPEAYATLDVAYSDLRAAIAGLQRVVDAHFDVYALDLLVDAAQSAPPTYRLHVRLGGAPALLRQRIDQLRLIIGDAAAAGEVLLENNDAAIWSAAREFTWAPRDAALVKVATTIGKIEQLEAAFATQGAQRRYAVGGNVLWLAWSAPVPALETWLTQQEISGLVIRGESSKPLLGLQPGQAFAQRIKQALDPQQRFPSF
ncbi:MAG: FAD-binding protein [Caldilineaceae bacterium]